jgi:DNA-directed RNA polymerase subunit L
MIIKVLKNEKDHLEIEIDNLTVAELLRNALWDDSSVTVASWKREHPTKNPILIVKTEGKTAKKALLDCTERIEKITDKARDDIKKGIKESKK